MCVHFTTNWATRLESNLYSLVSTSIICTPIMPLGYSWKHGTLLGKGLWPVAAGILSKGSRSAGTRVQVRCLSHKPVLSLVSVVTVPASDTGPCCRKGSQSSTLSGLCQVKYSVSLLYSPCIVSAICKADVSACWQAIRKNFNGVYPFQRWL